MERETASSTKGIASTLIQNADWIVTLVLAGIVAVLSIFNLTSLDVVAAAVLLVLGNVLINLNQSRNSIRRLADAAEALPNRVAEVNNNRIAIDANTVGLARILPHTVNYDWESELEKSRRAVIIRMRLNLGERLNFLRAVEAALARGGSVTLIIADPRSPAMWLRYMEEPKLGGASERSESAWVRGIEEIALDVTRLEKWTGALAESGKDTRRLSVLLAANYPGFAYLRFDRKLFVYGYPFQQRGYHGPAFLFEEGGSGFDHYNKCVAEVIGSAVPLSTATADDIREKFESGWFSDRVVERSAVKVVARKP